MQIQTSLRGLGLLVGMIIGAGMFALPYAVSKAGLFWSVFHFFLTAGIVTLAHLLYGSVLWKHSSRRRLPGYVRMYLGEGAYMITFGSRVISYFGYLLAYGLLGGIFLSYFSDTSVSVLTSIFFIAVSPFIFLNLRNLGSVNLLLTAVLVLFVVLLFALLFPDIHFQEIKMPSAPSAWFYPYGIFLFAFSGASVIPDVVELFKRKGYHLFQRTIVYGTLITAFVYFLFIAIVLGVSGGVVAEDGLGTLAQVSGENILRLGALVGLLAIITSFLALGIELRFTFQYDFGMPLRCAGLVVVLVPTVLYLLGIHDFIFIISIIGAIGVGIEGIMIALLARRANHAPLIPVILLTSLLTSGALLELARTFGIL